MYFNRRILLTTLGLISTRSAQATSCKQSSVLAMSDAGFLKYALLNCILSDQAGTTNILGEDVIDPEICVSGFIAAEELDIELDCKKEYVDFVDNLAFAISNGDHESPFEDPLNDGTTDHEECAYDATSDSLTMSYPCWNILSSYLEDFKTAAGYPIMINPCDAGTVRTLAMDGTLQQAITDLSAAIADGNTGDYEVYNFESGANAEGSSHIVVGLWTQDEDGVFKTNDVDLKTGMCYGAYQTVLDALQGLRDLPESGVEITNTGAGGNDLKWITTAGTELTDLQAACAENIEDATCANSVFISTLKAQFKELSGFDIDFEGPMCNAESTTELQAPTIEPAPFVFFVQCALFSKQFPGECSPIAVNQYLEKLETVVDTDCNTCFTELRASIKGLATSDAVTTACDVLENVTSDACVAAFGTIATDFEDCTGQALYTSAAEDDDTTDDDTEDDTEDDTDDGTSANDASNTSALMSSVAMVAVLAYMM